MMYKAQNNKLYSEAGSFHLNFSVWKAAVNSTQSIWQNISK